MNHYPKLFRKLDLGFLELKNGRKYTICIVIENGGKGSIIPTKMAKKIFEYIIGLDNV